MGRVVLGRPYFDALLGPPVALTFGSDVFWQVWPFRHTESRFDLMSSHMVKCLCCIVGVGS